MKKIFLSQYISQKWAVFFLVIFFGVSVLYISWQSHSTQNQTTPGSWEIGFVEPQGEDLSFFLENHQKDSRFSYSILQDGEVIDENATLQVLPGKDEEIVVDRSILRENGGVYRIDVRDASGNTRSIYKRM
jgi:hypothetical protein